MMLTSVSARSCALQSIVECCLVGVVLIKLIHQLCVVPIGDGDLVELCKGVSGSNSLAHIIVLCEVLCHIDVDVLWVI